MDTPTEEFVDFLFDEQRAVVRSVAPWLDVIEAAYFDLLRRHNDLEARVADLEKTRPLTPSARAAMEPREASDGPTRICVQCGQPLTAKQVENDRRFCSRGCFGKWKAGKPKGARYVGAPRYADESLNHHDAPVADYYGETSRLSAGGHRETVVMAGVGVRAGRIK